MSELERGPATGKSGAPRPAGSDSGRDRDEMTGDAPSGVDPPQPAGRGEASGGDQGAIDLESVRDRAS